MILIAQQPLGLGNLSINNLRLTSSAPDALSYDKHQEVYSDLSNYYLPFTFPCIIDPIRFFTSKAH